MVKLSWFTGCHCSSGGKAWGIRHLMSKSGPRNPSETLKRSDKAGLFDFADPDVCIQVWDIPERSCE